jgi:uncharacterized protein (TIGR03435 family)
MRTIAARPTLASAILWISLLCVPIPAQTPTTLPKFDVVSIKPNVSGGGGGTGILRPQPGGRLTAEGVLLRFFIQSAYGLKSYQISGGPSWLDSDRFDVQAKAESSPGNEQMMQMMQSLLQDRFQLKVHRETRDLPVYDLTVAKSGSKLPPPKEGNCVSPDPSAPALPPPPPPVQRGPTIRPACGRLMVMISSSGQMNGGKVSMAELTRVLSSILGRTVVDKTAITELFDVHLEFAFDESLAGIGGGPNAPRRSAISPDPAGPSIFSAIQDQLGLRLESTRGPVEVLVIDHVEKPVGN